jgi:hypothetical protein
MFLLTFIHFEYTILTSLNYYLSDKCSFLLQTSFFRKKESMAFVDSTKFTTFVRNYNSDLWQKTE